MCSLPRPVLLTKCQHCHACRRDAAVLQLAKEAGVQVSTSVSHTLYVSETAGAALMEQALPRVRLLTNSFTALLSPPPCRHCRTRSCCWLAMAASRR